MPYTIDSEAILSMHIQIGSLDLAEGNGLALALVAVVVWI